MRATVITDASWCPRYKVGGWAAWVVLSDTGERLRRHGRLTGPLPSSNEAELKAALNGLAIAYAAGARAILAQTDCLHVVQKATSLPLYTETKALWFPKATVRWRHVKGHTRRGEARYYVNRWCDEHAGRHMREQRTRYLFDGKRKRTQA